MQSNNDSFPYDVSVHVETARKLCFETGSTALNRLAAIIWLVGAVARRIVLAH